MLLISGLFNQKYNLKPLYEYEIGAQIGGHIEGLSG